MVPLIVIFSAAVIIGAWAGLTYNTLVNKRNIVKSGWADIDVQLKRRHDLIPNLVETVKGYAGHERTVLENVTKARASAIEAKNPQEVAKSENMLADALKSLFAVAENYPALRASENFQKLQQELANVENDIQSARRYYNAAVRELNTAVAVVPSIIIANLFGFKPAEFFGIESAEREAVTVKF